KEKATLTGLNQPVYALAFAPYGRTLATGAWDSTIKLWDVVGLKSRVECVGHQKMVHALAFTPDGKTLVTASGDNEIKLWKASSGRLLDTLIGHEGEVV